MNLRRLQPFHAAISEPAKMVHLLPGLPELLPPRTLCGTAAAYGTTKALTLVENITDIVARLYAKELTVCRRCVASRPFKAAAALLAMYSTGVPSRLDLLGIGKDGEV